MKIGKRYLVHLGDWHTFVGEVAEQLGPLTYELRWASKVDLTHAGGDVWDRYCAGDADVRAAAQHWHYPGAAVVPLSIVAMEYTGDLPHPDAPKSAPAGRGRRGAA